MLKKPKVKSTTGIAADRRGKPATSNNLYVSPSFIKKFRKFAVRKQKSHFSKSSSVAAENESTSKESPKDAAKLVSNVPKDVAVHFGSFYGVQEDLKKPQPGKVGSSSRSATRTLRTAPRLEFTRQMVHNLERTAGTEEYARQVSTLLEETVEPPHFKLHSLPTENSIPDGKQNPSGYPLWYKEPYKMPVTSEMYKLLKEEYEIESKIGKDVFEEEILQEDPWKEFSDEEQVEQDESPLAGNKTMEKEESLNALTGSSSSTTEAKDTDSKESLEYISDSNNNKITFRL
ncbi:uncharacterized protein LOC143179346 [Calliopsis andreniformis]|uniref:uncharacterized protein LOC143179346 n=1 Tax=Calliopsis andreniformis TaxID=337506 RepID=UPI003FCC700E